MSRRNQVTVEFRVVGDGLAALERAHRSFSAFGGLSTTLGRLNPAFANAAAGAGRLATQARGATSALQRIGEIAAGSLGGNVLANIFTNAATAAAGFAKESVGAALSAEQALVQLRTQSRLTGTDLAANIELAKQVAKEFRVSDTAGIGLTTAATRVTFGVGKPEETLKFLRAAADLSAAAGRPLSGLNETLRQFAAGGAQAEAALDKIGGGANPGAIMDAYAKKIGVASDALTELQRNQALYDFVIERSLKVQGVAQESLNSTTGRISALSAAYENTETRLGKLIISSELFKTALAGIETAASSLDKPETLTNFNASLDKARYFAEGVARGIAILKAEFTLFGAQTGIIWDTFTTKIGNAFTQIGLELKQFANDAVLAIVSAVEAIPKPVRDAIGIGISESDISAVLDLALKRKAEIDGKLQLIFAQNAGLDAAAGARLAQAQADFNKSIAGQPLPAPPGSGAAAATSDQLKALAGTLGGAAGAFAAEFKLVPITVETPDGLSSALGFQRVIKDQVAASVAASNNLGDKVAGLTAIMEESQANPVLARVEVVAGKDTSIEAVVPTGGANQP